MENNTRSGLLNQKTAIVTGASSGIGKAIALSLAKENAVVYLVGRAKDRLDAVTKEIESFGGKAIFCPVDISDLNEIDKIVNRAVMETGTLNIMVNNAGFELDSSGPIIDSNPEDWKSMFDVNVFALLKGSQSAIKAMRKGGFSGHIINLSSIGASTPGSKVYGATKAAVNYINEELRKELENDPIRLVQITPGAVFTNFARNMPTERIQGLLSSLQIESTFKTGDVLSDEVIASVQQAINKAFLSAEDIANSVMYAVKQPTTVNIAEIIIRPQGSIHAGH